MSRLLLIPFNPTRRFHTGVQWQRAIKSDGCSGRSHRHIRPMTRQPPGRHSRSASELLSTEVGLNRPWRASMEGLVRRTNYGGEKRVLNRILPVPTDRPLNVVNARAAAVGDRLARSCRWPL